MDECESKIGEFTSEMQNMTSDEEKEKRQNEIDKYQAMINFKNS